MINSELSILDYRLPYVKLWPRMGILSHSYLTSFSYAIRTCTGGGLRRETQGEDCRERAIFVVVVNGLCVCVCVTSCVS